MHLRGMPRDVTYLCSTLKIYSWKLDINVKGLLLLTWPEGWKDTERDISWRSILSLVRTSNCYQEKKDDGRKNLVIFSSCLVNKMLSTLGKSFKHFAASWRALFFVCSLALYSVLYSLTFSYLHTCLILHVQFWNIVFFYPLFHHLLTQSSVCLGKVQLAHTEGEYIQILWNCWFREGDTQKACFCTLIAPQLRSLSLQSAIVPNLINAQTSFTPPCPPLTPDLYVVIT